MSPAVTSAYWLNGFTRVWAADADADEEESIRAWYGELLGPYLRRRPLRTLDVGCGSGRVVSAVAQLCPDAFHVAIDGSEEAVAQTARRLTDERINGVVEQVDLTEPAFAGRLLAQYGRFDLVTCFYVLHHYDVKTIGHVLAQFRNLLTDEGLIVLAECHDPNDELASTTEQVCARLARLAGQPADLLLTIDQLRAACDGAGFEPDDIRIDLRSGQPFTERERERHTATVAGLRARVAALGSQLGSRQPAALAELESIVETMARCRISGQARHAPALAVLGRGRRHLEGASHDARIC
jgi:SAM-dependent methyltransferase